MMDQLAGQMEHMSAEIQQLRDQKMIAIQKQEREWYEAQTKRMDVEGKLMMTDTQLQASVRENLQLMLSMGGQQTIEETQEYEQLEAETMALGQQQQQPQPQGQPQAPAAPRSAGSMTRKPDVGALTSNAKPGESL